MSAAADFVAALRPASFRGVPFAVTAGRKVFGRRTAVHDYPFRDTIWVEDLGRKGREISLAGFLVTDSIVYGGGDVLDQQDQLVAAAEGAGPGTLVHPTLGALTVSCLSCAISESFDTLGALMIELTFLEAGEKVFPDVAGATGAAVASAADDLDSGASADADTDGAPLLVGGPPQTNLAASVVGDLSDLITTAAADATGVFNLACQLPGDFGRYFSGAAGGAFGAVAASLYAASTTVDDLIDLAANARGAIASAQANLVAVADNLGLGASSASFADLATAAQGAVASLLAATADPADAIRLLTGLAQAAPAGVAAASPIGLVASAVFRRAAIAALGRAAMAYQPSSCDDAQTVMLAVTAVIDTEITLAGDAADDATFTALRALRVAVIADLTARGADLASTMTVNTAEPTPSLVLAQNLYRDPTRAAQLEAEADPVHPLFMPQTFQALAA